MTTDGKITPLSLEFSERWYNILKVVEERKMASTKGGGKGTRYACKIGSKIHYLFFDENRWWVELKL